MGGDRHHGRGASPSAASVSAAEGQADGETGKRASSPFSRDARNGSDVATGDRIIVGWQYAPRFAMEMNTDER